MADKQLSRQEREKKLATLPWQALHDFGIKKGLSADELRGKDKHVLIHKILEIDSINDEMISELVNDYIYGNRVTFTIWRFAESLTQDQFDVLCHWEGIEKNDLGVNGFHNLQIVSVEEHQDRIEIVYVYGKEYRYIDESGRDAGVWEQHRGCLWVGTKQNYVAFISKHDRMTKCVIDFIQDLLDTSIKQVKMPQKAIDQCVDTVAISRIVLQGLDGEKTIISNATGLTEDQQQEVDNVKDGRFVPAGNRIANIGEKHTATIKYNLNKGSLGIYKHLPAPMLFKWTEEAIRIILDEIDRLKGKQAQLIFSELGMELKWPGLTSEEKLQFEWFLTKAIQVSVEKSIDIALPDTVDSILWESKWFMVVPRIFCESCETDEIPICSSCGKALKYNATERKLTCDCGAPIKAECSEGHKNVTENHWFIPTPFFMQQIKKKIKQVYPDDDYNFCFHIRDRYLHMECIGNVSCSEVEIPFHAIDCFDIEQQTVRYPEHIFRYAALLKEKCDGVCSNKKILECLKTDDMMCLPKLFYEILPGFRPQPHRNGEYGDVSGQIKANGRSYELKGIIKKNTANTPSKSSDLECLKTTVLTSSLSTGREIIQQFVEQGMIDARCQVIAVIAPQYFDANFKGTLKYLARLVNKKIVFIQLEEICEIVSYKNLSSS